MASTDARPVPIKNTAFRAYFDLRLNTGALNSGAAGLDSEVSKDGGTITDCTNEATEIATSSGHYYLDLTSTEMNADSVVVQIKSSTTNAVTRSLLIYPQELGDIKVDVQSLLGTAWLAPGTAGTPDVNAKLIGATAQTGRDLGTSVLLSSGTGTGQISLSSGGVSLSTSGLNAAADAVWDEALSGHVAAGSAGAAMYIIRSATAQSGTGTTIVLDASASATDDFYNNARLFIVAGTGAGQGRYITDYTGSSKTATVPTWITNPSSDSVFVILPAGGIPGASAPTAAENADAVWDELRGDHVSAGSFGQYFAQLFRSGTAQAGTSTTITLDASASATNNIYNYSIVSIISGTGALQSRQITAYTGSSKVATVGIAWTTNPSSDSVFVITPLGVDAATLAAIADAVWDEARSGHATAGTFGEYVNADTVRLSGDATAADNAEAFFDGTGYAGTNNVIPTVTTVATVTAVTGLTASDVGAIKTKTDFLPSATAGAAGGVFIAGANAATSVTTALTANITGNLSGTVGSLATQAKADVNAEVVDCLNTDTYAEPGQEAPPATTTFAKKLGYLYKMLRNKKTQTATTFSLFADDASTVDQKAAVSDSAGTTTSGEIGTGP